MKRSFLIYALFFICSVVQAQWECAYDGTTGNLTSRQGVNGTEQENFIFDYLGSYLRLYTDDGTEVFSAEYDAWGRQTAKNVPSSLPSTLNSFSFHRGYTGHEMLPAFGLINKNAAFKREQSDARIDSVEREQRRPQANGRLYDPARGGSIHRITEQSIINAKNVFYIYP